MAISRHYVSLQAQCLQKGSRGLQWACNRQHHRCLHVLSPGAPRMKSNHQSTATTPETVARQISPLSRLSTTNIVRSLILGSVITSPSLYKSGIALLSWVANSRLAILDPDKNTLLRWMIRILIYDHFCAGTKAAEVRDTISGIKKMGYSGVILCYGKEIILHDPSSSDGSLSTSGSDMGTSAEEQIAQWRDGQLETLKYISAGDFIGIKYTGAGPEVVNALAEGRDLPAQVLEAMDIICKQAAAQGSSIWIDAEQQALQPTIDAWTIDLMRYYNRDGTALISNTIQAYLKGARRSVENHLHIAQREGWSLGIKLVRGAYIEKEVRSLIHDTKEDTDNSYNEIVRDLLCKSWPGFEGESFPDTHLFLAGHNSESIRMACETVRTQVKSGKKVGVLRFGQLQGMADEVSCKLLQQGEEARNCDGLSEDEAEIQRQMIPMAYKCLTWGSVQECLQFLLRRAIENRGATERMRAAFPELKAELRRRMLV